MSLRSPLLASAFLSAAFALAVFNSPTTASAQASPASNTSASRTPQKTHPADPPLDAGSISSGVYRNPALAFTCKIPPAWVLRTEEMNARDREDPTPSGTPAKDAGNARVLLAAFSRPPEARGEDINSSILIAAESLSAYPGLKDAAQYFGPVTEIAKAQGFETDEEPYDFAVGTKTLVRGDFEKNVGTRVMRQSTLVMLARGYAVSFTFIGGTEDEVEELIASLSFNGTGSGKPGK